ncbi:hypothetical protein TEA_025118 [Camellia sinensis var. sinensis]|uniref:Uncharacterized protein n=1 Tax=Camellia sinensis var. sinensis TaxID=542762 RepID=A0A4S4DM11_CAMSN|nr:hypothetical protein TEA_025118 [Camellia sinensis var. sinensis]
MAGGGATAKASSSVRIVVVGERDTGKSSLIVTAAATIPRFSGAVIVRTTYQSPPHSLYSHFNLIPSILARALTIACLFFLTILYRKLSWKRTALANLKPPHRFSYSFLHRTISSFSIANRLGQGDEHRLCSLCGNEARVLHFWCRTSTGYVPGTGTGTRTGTAARVPGTAKGGPLNGVELRGCKIKYCDSNKGFGLFLSDDVSDAVLLVVPLDLAITPMRVLEDPILGPECRAMFEEGEVDDRFLMNLFLTVERLRKNSSWKPYLDMLPTTFGNPLWFTDDEFLELKGTTLYRATELQVSAFTIVKLFTYSVKCVLKTSSGKHLLKELLANSIFWTRALNIPFPRSYVFPQVQDEQDNTLPSFNGNPEASISNISSGELVDGKGLEVHGVESQVPGVTSTVIHGETVWVEGLVPGIDFCNHGISVGL